MTTAPRVANKALVTIIYLFLWLPILIVVVVSFDTSTFLRFPPHAFSLAPYRAVAQTTAFTSGLAASLIIAVFATIITMAVAVTGALVFVRHPFRGAAVIQSFFLSPLLVPHIILGLAILLLFAPLGLNDTHLGLVLAHTVVCLPYALRTVMVSLATADAACEDAARVHGASAWRTFWRVTLPLIRPGLIAGAVLAFLVSFDEAVVSLFLTGFSVTTLPVALLTYMETQAGPEVAALSVLLIAFSIVLVVIVERVVGLSRTLRL